VVRPGQQLLTAAHALLKRLTPARVHSILREPVFIVSAPRSGSTALFDVLKSRPGFHTIGGESHGVFRAFPALRAEDTDLTSGRLGKNHVDADVRRLLPACFLCLLRDYRGKPYLDLAPEQRPARVRFLEKTPRNALNIPFLLEVFPEARFIFLHRDPRENIASIMEAWRHGLAGGRFVTFRDLPGWDRPAWCFLLPPGWREMTGRSLAEIAAFQWRASNETIMDDLVRLPRTRRMAVAYRELVGDPRRAVTKLCRFAGVADDVASDEPLPLSRTALTPPHPEKWRRHAADIDRLMPSIAATCDRIREFAEAGNER
jgi:hypothetical protein